MIALANPLHVGIAVDDRALRQGSEKALRTFSPFAITTQMFPERGAGLLALSNRAKPGVLVADLQALGSDFGNIIRQLRSQPSPPDIIVLHSAPDAGAILQSMRAGAREFFFEDIETSVRQTITAIESAATPSQAPGKLYAFLGVKGGCGATTVASYTAASLARESQPGVLLTDMNWDCPGTAFLLRETPQHSMQDALRKMDRMDRALWDAMATSTSHGFALGPTPTEEETAAPIQPAHISALLPFLKTQYGHVVADCGSGWNALTPAVTEAADEMIIVTTPDLTALHHAKRMLRALRESSDPSKLRVLLNRASKRADLGNGDLENILGHAIFACLPNEYGALAQACEKGVLLPAEHAYSLAVTAFASKVTGGAEKPKKKLFKFFGK